MDEKRKEAAPGFGTFLGVYTPGVLTIQGAYDPGRLAETSRGSGVIGLCQKCQ